MAIACGYHIVNEACRCCVSGRSRVLNTQKTCIHTGLKISTEKGSIQDTKRFDVAGDVTYGRTGAPKKALDSKLNKVLKAVY